MSHCPTAGPTGVTNDTRWRVMVGNCVSTRNDTVATATPLNPVSLPESLSPHTYLCPRCRISGGRSGGRKVIHRLAFPLSRRTLLNITGQRAGHRHRPATNALPEDASDRTGGRGALVLPLPNVGATGRHGTPGWLSTPNTGNADDSTVLTTAMPLPGTTVAGRSRARRSGPPTSSTDRDTYDSTTTASPSGARPSGA
jgi:hypothetical protein